MPEHDAPLLSQCRSSCISSNLVNGELQGRLEPYRIGGEEMGPCRVWLADADTPGLSMTRAFGDVVASTVGIIAQPEIMQVNIKLPVSPIRMHQIRSTCVRPGSANASHANRKEQHIGT